MEKIKFSLIIPVAPERNVEIIESIKKLDYPKSNFHVIVVKGTNPSKNRNKGALKARGGIIVFLDDDAVLDKNYLKEAERFFEEHKNIDIVGGPQLTPIDDKLFAKISGYALSSMFGAWKLSSRYSLNREVLNVDETALTSANLICKKKVMEKVQFDPSLFPGEDPKFISDAKNVGFRVGYSPNIILYHRRRVKIKELIKQIYSYGKTRPKKESFSETIKKPFFLVPSLFLIYLLFLLLTIIINPQITRSVIEIRKAVDVKNYSQIFNFLWFFPLIFYIFLCLIFAVYDSAKNKNYKAIFILLFIYPIIHLSYGTGMIYGHLKNLKI